MQRPRICMVLAELSLFEITIHGYKIFSSVILTHMLIDLYCIDFLNCPVIILKIN